MYEYSENYTKHFGLNLLRGQNMELLNYKQVANTFNSFSCTFNRQWKNIVHPEWRCFRTWIRMEPNKSLLKRFQDAKVMPV